MGIIRYKILRDLWGNKGRTIQVVLIIGIGAAAIGMIIGTRNLMIPAMQEMWTRTNPSMIYLYVGPPVSDDDLRVLQKVPGVTDTEGVSTAIIEWRVSPQEDWRSGTLNARVDYPNQRLDKVELMRGDWPEGDRLAIENADDLVFGMPVSGQVYLRVKSRIYKMETGGMLYNQRINPATFAGTPQFYATRETFEKLLGTRDYNQVMVNAAQWDEAAVTSLADTLQKKLKDMGRESGRWITNPNEHFFQASMDGLFFILGALSGLTLLLGLLLVYNTINGIILGQVDQIGIMKAIGARTGNILRIYLTLVLAYGVLAALFAVPLAILGGQFMSNMLVGAFSASSMGGVDVSPIAIVVTIAVALLAPLLSAIVPVISAARVTVRQAINTYGLSAKTGLLERLLSRARRISRMFLLTLSNTFRNKRRVILLEIALVLSGVMFMSVVSVRDSVGYTINDTLFDILDADITYLFSEPQHINILEKMTLAHPSVASAEMWGLQSGTMRPSIREKSEDDKQGTLFGVPLPTKLYGYRLIAGRWLDPADTYAMVMNEQQADEVGVGVGDWVTVEYEQREERAWQVVGLVFDPMNVNVAFVPRDLLLRDIGQTGRAFSVWIQTKAQDAAGQIAIAKELRQYYENNHVPISPQRGVFGNLGDATVDAAQKIISQFNIIVLLLAVMAIVIGVVGGIALSGALSLSVMERSREIGVMRAIGASSGKVSRLFIGEGLILGWLSWLLAVPLSIPLAQVLLRGLMQAFGFTLIYHYTNNGAILWLIIITVLAILASVAPALRATRISVRQSLVYQ
jgi:putative ABC transport system permease protein